MAKRRVNAVIVGSGAGGGMMSKELAEAGLSVVLFERGKQYTPLDFKHSEINCQCDSDWPMAHLSTRIREPFAIPIETKLASSTPGLITTTAERLQRWEERLLHTELHPGA